MGLIKVCGVLFMLFLCMNSTSDESKEEIQENLIEPVEIVDTVPLPDPEQNVVEMLKDEIHETRHWDEGCFDTTLQIDQEDAVRLMKIAAAEAGTEGVEGQYLIMRVIINRLNSESYPDSIAEIIAQPHQFQTYSNGTYWNTEPNVDSHLALAKLESNKEPDTDIIAFENASNGNVLLRWFDMKYSYHNHIFYTKKP